MRNRPALTLVELVLTITVMVLLSTGFLLSLSTIRQRQALKLSTENLTAELTRARIFSRENKEQKSWGIRAEGFGGYTVMNRDGAGRSDVMTYPLIQPASLTRDDFEIWFDQVTGGTAGPVSIEITVPRGDRRVIEISQFGTVEVR